MMKMQHTLKRMLRHLVNQLITMIQEGKHHQEELYDLINFQFILQEKFTESYNGPRGLLGLGNISATTYKILRCGNNENDNNNDNNNNTNGGNRTNYFTMTMTEDIVNNQDDNQDNINSSNTTIEGFF